MEQAIIRKVLRCRLICVLLKHLASESAGGPSAHTNSHIRSSARERGQQYDEAAYADVYVDNVGE